MSRREHSAGGRREGAEPFAPRAGEQETTAAPDEPIREAEQSEERDESIEAFVEDLESDPAYSPRDPGLKALKGG